MCLKEGLSDAELNCCKVVTVGDKKMIRRKLQELVGMFLIQSWQMLLNKQRVII